MNKARGWHSYSMLYSEKSVSAQSQNYNIERARDKERESSERDARTTIE